MRKNIWAILAAAVLTAFFLPSMAAGQGARAAEAPDMPPVAADTAGSDTDIVVEDSSTDTDAPPTVTPDPIQPPAGGTGWRYVPQTGDYYYFKDYVRKGDYWVGKAEGASAWPDLWYYADASGRLLTGFQYLDDLKGGKAWYMLQVGDANGTTGKMLTGWQETYVAGRGYFSPSYGSQGMCLSTADWGKYDPATGLWADGLSHRRT